ncbi:MAG: hypothetical protein GY751_05795, partial [Bacteroidetes bacterium]|nr:hypothetical protein [Bacteroidota bacterium]
MKIPSVKGSFFLRPHLRFKTSKMSCFTRIGAMKGCVSAIATLLLITSFQLSFAQNRSYEVWVDHIRFDNTPLSTVECYELNGSEASTNIAFKDNVDGSWTSDCYTCEIPGIGGQCYWSSGAVLNYRSRTNDANTINTDYEAWEDDTGNRCSFDDSGGLFVDDDDCHVGGSNNISFNSADVGQTRCVTNTDGDWHKNTFCWRWNYVSVLTPNVTPSVSNSGCCRQYSSKTPTQSNVTWYWQTASDGISTANSTASTYTVCPSPIGQSSTTRYLRAKGDRTNAWSAAREVTVNFPAQPSVSISGAATICVGGNRTLTATASGGTGCSYQWQRATSTGGPWSNVGTNSSSYNTGSLSSTFVYRVKRNCTGASCGDPISNTQTVTVVADPSVSISGGATICTGGNRTLTATTSGGTGTCTFQWQRATSSGGPWTNVGSNSSTYNTGTLTSTFVYRVVRNCNGSGCNDPVSNTQTVTVVPDPSVSISGGGAICTGGNRTLTASTSGGTGTCTFQWQRATSTGGPWTNVGSNSSTYNTGTLTSTFVYRVVRNCNGSGCADPISNTQTVTVVSSTDADGDGHYTPGSCLTPADDCDDSNSDVFPGAPELCDGLDNDCDGALGSDEIDDDSDGYTECDGDCDDADSGNYPGNTEVCDGQDNDCD